MTTTRTKAVVAAETDLSALLDRLLRLAETGLPAMYRPERKTFVFTRAAVTPAVLGAEPRLEDRGESVRYAAITVLGAKLLPEDRQRPIFGGLTAAEYAGVLVEQLPGVGNLGDAALVTWAAADTRHPKLDDALARLAALDDLDEGAAQPRYTVEAAWVLSALCAARGLTDATGVERRLQTARDRLLRARLGAGPLFPHATGPGLLPWYRAHVGCFADQTYPLQALARAHASTEGGDPAALAAADACAARICELQGEGGQWWWHYDARHGTVVEGYPVYSVHQHAMAPTALLDLTEAGGADHGEAIRRGLRWMTQVPELREAPGGGTPEPMIHDDLGVTWRKVFRGDPRKAVRAARGVGSLLVPGLRLEPLERLYPPVALDRECRPYEFGWMLHAWLGSLDSPER
ncbi:hypothetical protein [Streptacidiphilus jiangxiensis]|uniref:Uncharacterized protein n=1 Tax=Streptacidiphilus jiangxiensis TaxID=235985 RepID=A0A1H7XKE9_STRJI|nr:hypothetical protein [Streptacidiphilus jiangxiensis]SEM33489.1 hypothetical protein SAMN05414137_12438 [Streptacidiphilus jiangxiensis]